MISASEVMRRNQVIRSFSDALTLISSRADDFMRMGNKLKGITLLTGKQDHSGELSKCPHD